MRILNETEMSVVAGGALPPSIPQCPPKVEPPEKNDWWIDILWPEQEICDDLTHECPRI